MQRSIQDTYEEHANRLTEKGIKLYPTWSGRTHRTQDIRDTEEELIASKNDVTIAGRVYAIRSHGGSTFFDVHDISGKIQTLFRADALGKKPYDLLSQVDHGDIVSATGSVIKTKAGETTIDAKSWTMLAKSRLPLPDTWYGLRDVEKRARQRELDLLMNETSRNTFRMRCTIIETIRTFLRDRNFREVETPILQPIPGGTSARPFVTRHNALDIDLYLRISPELYLKRLIVGGEERVFEIARCFRNEGVDRSHNPEFTNCEFYMAYATMEDLISVTGELIHALLLATGNAETISYQGKKLKLAAPWKEVSVVKEMEKKTGINVLDEKDPKVYLSWMEKQGIPLPEITSLPSVLDAVYKEVIRKHVWDAIIVRDFPVAMEPLAKRSEDDPRIVQRFQLVAAGAELLKAYTELNDPVDQRDRFLEQEAFLKAGDDEAQRVDEAFLHALNIGLPPTAGWGMGVDRITMLLTDTANIRDVITFPLMRPKGEHT